MLSSKKHINLKHQSGVALIAILLIVAVVAALATQMHWQHKISVKRIDNLLNIQQARQYANGGESWAREILIEDIEDSTLDHLGETWATPLPPLPIDGGAIQGQMVDLQARFNVNNLINSDGRINNDTVAQFKLLLQNLDLEPELVSAIVDWIDSDNYPEFPGGAEDSSYSTLATPYLTANHYISDISELMSVNGIDKAVFTILSPHISALPINTAININTASLEVIASLSSELSQTDIESVINSRDSSHFETVSEFYEMTNLDGSTINISTQSEYFLLEVEVLLHDRLHRRHTYLYRDAQNGNVSAYQRKHSPYPMKTEPRTESETDDNSES